MEFLALWIFLAVLVGIYASTKGHSAGGAFVMALILSPLIWGIVEMLRAPNRPGERTDDAPKRCPACAELIQAAARKCRYCGEQLAEDSVVATEQWPPAPPPHSGGLSSVTIVLIVIGLLAVIFLY